MRLYAENIYFAYSDSKPVIRGVALELRPGTVTGLFGPNGCGKTTLLRCLNATLTPQEGRVMLDNIALTTLSRRQIAARIATLGQDIPAQLPFTVAEVVMLGRYPAWRMFEHENAEDYRIVDSCLQKMELGSLAQRQFDTLSGGEKQLTLLARALAQETPILLLDEPASHLDIAHHLHFLTHLRKVAASGKSVLLVCHDLFATPMFLDRACLLHQGVVVAEGEPAGVLTARNLRHAFDCSIEVSRLTANTISVVLPEANPSATFC